MAPILPPAMRSIICRNKGFKWEHINLVAEQHRDTVRQYDYIWCPDDDIACDTAGVNKLFEIVRKYNVQLAQPAISEGEFAFKSLIQQRGNILRYSPYVEVMCPVFTQAAFFKLQDTFLENRSAWGLDWIWPKRFALTEMAIIDKVGVHHTGRLGKERITNCWRSWESILTAISKKPWPGMAASIGRSTAACSAAGCG